ncbi:MAG: hypothetical protein ABFR32_13040 [Bacteroidota bacterium]
MKKLFLIILIVFIGCSDDDEQTLNSQLTGEWKWVESSGGIGGITETLESTGKEITLEFTSEIKKTFINSILEYESAYYLENGESITSTEKVDLIIYDNGVRQAIEINDGYLVLIDEYFDGYMHGYIKK